MTSPYYTTTDLMHATGMSLRTIYNHVQSGRLRGARCTLKRSWRFPASEVSAWANLYLKPRIKSRLLAGLDKPPPPRWCYSPLHDELHLIFDDGLTKGECTARLERPRVRWQPASRVSVLNEIKCAACLKTAAFWEAHGHAP